MLPSNQSGMFLPPKVTCEHEVMIACIDALSGINDQLMKIADAISENAASIRKTLDTLSQLHQDAEETKSDQNKSILGSIESPGEPGVFLIQIDPNNPDGGINAIQDIIKKLGGGPNAI
jgi:hypothetical protein